MAPSVSAAPTRSLTNAVRTHFGVSARQLARYLRVSAAFVMHVEAGRRGLPPTRVPRLLHLVRLLPPPLGQGPPAPLAPPPPHDPLLTLPAPETLAPPLPDEPAPAPDPLRRRLRDQRLLLLTLGVRLAAEQVRAAALRHRRRGLALLHTLPPPPDPADATHLTRWLQDLADDLLRDDPDPAARAATRHLLAARLAGLRAEVAALEAASYP